MMQNVSTPCLDIVITQQIFCYCVFMLAKRPTSMALLIYNLNSPFKIIVLITFKF